MANLKEYLPWLLSAITCYMTVMVGNKSRHSWTLGIANQVLWVVWIVVAQAWGLLPMTAMLTVIYVRNHLRWKEERIPPMRLPSLNLGDDVRRNVFWLASRWADLRVQDIRANEDTPARRQAEDDLFHYCMNIPLKEKVDGAPR